ncbi:MAG TPA: tripartite tricarboxylate transporter permease [Herbaspirillum sp.]|jgi:TctA family transporter
MYDHVIQGLVSFGTPASLLFICFGVFIGTLVGLIPGVNGVTALALLMPFVYGMHPAVGLSFMVATHAVVNTAGSITAVLLGMPGEPADAAAVVDGFPMTKQGRGGEAIGAALAASGIGGVFGAAVLALLLPVLAPVVLYFKSPDTLMLAVCGVMMIALVAKGNMAKGLMAGALGMLFATFGYQGASGVPRFWFNMDYLLDGFDLIPVTLGLFALPEIISLGVTGKRIAAAGTPPVVTAQVMKGVYATLSHRMLVLRSSLIGVVLGIIPGMGGAVAPWISYAAAQRSSKNPEAFGKGAVEGVIAASAPHNAKEGGGMIPTLAFGIPAGSSMAVLIGAFFMFGLSPGPDFLKSHMDVAVHLTLTLALANVIAVLALIPVTARLTSITRIPGRLLAPMLMVTLVVGTYATNNEPLDIVFLMAFGVLGIMMKELTYSRPAFLLGFVLAPMIENSFGITLEAHGWGFLLRPIPIAVCAVVVLRVLWSGARFLRPSVAANA